jgi:predicted nucleic acid-binding protein
MGQVVLPLGALVYLDANPIIYTIEAIDPYFTILTSLWNSVQANDLAVLTSRLTILETLVKPLRDRDELLIDAYDRTFRRSDLEVKDISEEVLKSAALLRSQYKALRTPDAIHLATALTHGCSHFVSNDVALRSFEGIELVILADFVTT